MYTLRVYFPDEMYATHIEAVEHTVDVIPRIPELLQEHSGCHRIVVHFGMTQLFSVDHMGERLPE